MKLGVLHLSDIHFRYETDPARKYGACIAKACYESARRSDEFIIVVTGDIAFGGQDTEYKYAAELLSTISGQLQTEISKPVNIFLAPGNHDCILKPEDAIRETIIEKIVETQGHSLNEDFVNLCTKAQRGYFAFEAKMRIGSYTSLPEESCGCWTTVADQVAICHSKTRLSSRQGSLALAWSAFCPLRQAGLGRLPASQRIETTFLSRVSLMADTERLPVAAS